MRRRSADWPEDGVEWQGPPPLPTDPVNPDLRQERGHADQQLAAVNTGSIRQWRACDSGVVANLLCRRRYRDGKSLVLRRD